MKTYSNFDTYWRECGKYEPEVIDNPSQENSFKSFAAKIWKNEINTLQCKNEALEADLNCQKRNCNCE